MTFDDIEWHSMIFNQFSVIFKEIFFCGRDSSFVIRDFNWNKRINE